MSLYSDRRFDYGDDPSVDFTELLQDDPDYIQRRRMIRNIFILGIIIGTLLSSLLWALIGEAQGWF